MLTPSDRSLDALIRFETGGRAYYDQHLSRPTWPGLASGVTIGVGYDCGYNGAAEIRATWRPLGTRAADELAGTAWLRGHRAGPAAKALAHIVVPWILAKDVFQRVTLPRWMDATARAFPGVTGLPPDAQGALLSLVFNRGASMFGDARTEMRAIRELVPRGDLQGIADQIRAMKRLWAGRGMDGLLRRRDAEAALVLGR